uniref:BZIP domain-containing protein n=1 Tax=Tetradesmus obliquus TaxID=3088 RepID=A0A383VKC7_TETOB|eukprot:jgi/Sobl393_1/17263/SZX65192.1
MQSPVLDPCLASSEDLGFLDLFDETAGAPGKSMDLEICLDHLGGYQPASRPDRDQLLRAALRSHPEYTVHEAGAHAHAGLDDPLQQVDNNAAAVSQPSAAAAAVAVKPEPATAAAPAATSFQQEQQQPQQSASKSSRQKTSIKKQDLLDSESDGEATQGGRGTSKRRRRIRNAKQQELNRLAQQRYRERKKQKYCNLQGTVDELSVRLSQLNTLEAANSELAQRNGQLEGVVKQQQVQLQQQQDTISKQAQQLQTQAQQLAHQAQQLQSQVLHIEQQDRQLAELKGRTAGGSSSSQQQQPADADQLNDQLALAVRAVLTGVSSMTSMLPAKDAQQMQQVVTTLPDSILQQIRSCCREVALHLKKTDVKEMPHAVQVPCC